MEKREGDLPLCYELLTDRRLFLADRTARLSDLRAPDSITTYQLSAVMMSQHSGIGLAQAQLKIFQPFFVRGREREK